MESTPLNMHVVVCQRSKKLKDSEMTPHEPKTSKQLQKKKKQMNHCKQDITEN